MSHYMKVCPACNVIWEQCRCSDPSKEKTLETCPSCKMKSDSCLGPTVKEGEPQTCPRRSEGPQFDVKNEDYWETSNWRFTDPEEARKWNQGEADRKNAEYAAKGNKSSTHANVRYWLWPGPGPKPQTCSYCGCIRPEDVLRLKKEFGFTVSRTTKGYKAYIHPPGYEVGLVNARANMDAGVDPVEAYSGQKTHDISPPLKAYSPHFTEAQWKELLS